MSKSIYYTKPEQALLQHLVLSEIHINNTVVMVIFEEFVNRIIPKVKKTICGTYGSNENLEIDPLLKDGYSEIVKRFLKRNKDKIILKGSIEDDIVLQSIICKTIAWADDFFIYFS